MARKIFINELSEIIESEQILKSKIEAMGIKDENVERVLDIINSLRPESNDSWQPPQPSSDSTVWRYLDFTQFMSILERESIWFSNIREFEDPYEGTIPKKNVKDEIDIITNEIDIQRETAERVHNEVTSGNKYSSGNYVNCWILNNHESAALWEQYIDSNEGVALSTTVNSLESSVSDDEFQTTYGKVEYIDYQNERIPSGRLPTLYHKRKSFEHENEYRASFSITDEENPDPGKYVPVDIDELIDQVYLSPTSQDWFYDQVDSVLRTYNIDCELVQSDILSDPVY